MKRFIFVLSAILLSSLFLNAQSSSGRSSSLRFNWGTPDWLWHYGYYFSFGMDAGQDKTLETALDLFLN